MYYYTLRNDIKNCCKFYNKHSEWITWESFKRVVNDYGWPSDYIMHWVLCKAYHLKFYSVKKLNQIPVYGYLLPSNLFICHQYS